MKSSKSGRKVRDRTLDSAPSLKMIDIGPAIAELEKIFPMAERVRPKTNRARGRPSRSKSG